MLIKRAAPPGATGRVYGTVYSGLDIGFAGLARHLRLVLDHVGWPVACSRFGPCNAVRGHQPQPHWSAWGWRPQGNLTTILALPDPFMRQLELRGDYIELDKLLKAVGLVSSGGEARMRISEGEVTMDGAQELQVRPPRSAPARWWPLRASRFRCWAAARS